MQSLLLPWLPGLADAPAWTTWVVLALAQLLGTLAWLLATEIVCRIRRAGAAGPR